MRRICFVFALLVFTAALYATDNQNPTTPSVSGGFKANSFSAPRSLALSAPSALAQKPKITLRGKFDFRANKDVIAGLLSWKRHGYVVERPCYAMRTYTVEKVNPSSDETRVVGESTCMPASKAELKEAEPSFR